MRDWVPRHVPNAVQTSKMCWEMDLGDFGKQQSDSGGLLWVRQVRFLFKSTNRLSAHPPPFYFLFFFPVYFGCSAVMC